MILERKVVSVVGYLEYILPFTIILFKKPASYIQQNLKEKLQI